MQENHAKVMTVFRQFDRNGDGQITAAEFQSGCQKLGIPATPEDIQQLVASFDADHSGSVDYNELFKGGRRFQCTSVLSRPLQR